MKHEKRDYELLANIGGSPMGPGFIDYLERLKSERLSELMENEDDATIHRLQGRASELNDLIDVVKIARNKLHST